MRFYSLIITSQSGQLWTPPGFQGVNLGGASYTSLVNGVTLPGAWEIELDIFSYAFGSNFSSNGKITIWGISLQEIWQASNLNRFNISVYAGMAQGLPLANVEAPYAGLIARGMILPAFGNWIELNQTLELTIIPGSSTNQKPLFGSNNQPANISFNWQKGTPLSQALQTSLGTAFPGVTANINISPSLVAPQTMPGYYATLDQFASYINKQSLAVNNSQGYAGVTMAYDPSQNAVNVSDGTQQTSAPIQLQFWDLIGQPTWLGPVVNFKTPMRSDLIVGKQVVMPAGLNPITTPQSSLIANNNSSFQGTYRVINARHVGKSREPSADAWVTVVDAVQAQPQATGSNG